MTAPSAAGLSPEVSGECFAPAAVVARYGDEKELISALELTPSSLTALVLRGRGGPGAPQEVLPEELTDSTTRIPRRIDGVLELPR